MKNYKVLSNLTHDGKQYKPESLVVLPTEAAEPLLLGGVVEEAIQEESKIDLPQDVTSFPCPNCNEPCKLEDISEVKKDGAQQKYISAKCSLCGVTLTIKVFHAAKKKV